MVFAGYIAIGAMITTAMIAAWLVASSRIKFWLACLVSLATVVFVQSMFFSPFEWDSPYKLGSVLRVSALLTAPTLLGAVIGIQIRKANKKKAVP